MIEVASSNPQVFSNTAFGDIMIYGESNRQAFHFGNANNSVPYVSMTSNMIYMSNPVLMASNLIVNGRLSVSNVTYVTSNIIIYSNEIIQSNLEVHGGTVFHSVQDGGSVFLSSSNNSLGINTSNPEALLHVAGKTYSANQVLGPSNDSATIPAFSFRDDSNTGMFHPTTDAIGFATGGTERVRVTATGNVGIGTTSPAYPLDVAGVVNAQSLYVNGAPYVGSQWSNSAANVFIMNSNIGIGLSNPDALLTLRDAIPTLKLYNSSNASFEIAIANSNAAVQPFTKAGDTVLRSMSNIVVTSSQPAYTLINIKPVTPPTSYITKTFATDFNLPYGSAIASIGSSNVFTQAVVNQQALYYPTGGYSNQAYISFNSRSNVFYSKDNIAYKVKDNGGLTVISMMSINSNQSFPRIFSAYGEGYLEFIHAGNTLTFGAGGKIGNFTVSVNNAFSYGEWAVFTARWNTVTNEVAILKNTTTLVSGTSAYSSNVIQTNSYIGKSGNADPYLDAYISHFMVYDSFISDTTLSNLVNTIIQPFNPPDYMYNSLVLNKNTVFTLNSSFGIGNSNPGEVLHVTGKTYSTGQLLGTIDDSSLEPAFSFRDNSNTGMFHAATNAIGFATGGAERLRINSTGNVGIGTTSPNNALDVNGNIGIVNATLPMGLMTEIGGTTPILNMSVNFREPNKTNTYLGAGIRIDTRAEGPLFQWLHRAPGTNVDNIIMALNSNGQLGIGTTVPSYKLDVAGDINFTGSLRQSGTVLNAGSQWTSSGANIYINGSNVGIGLTNPYSKLHVHSGDLYISKQTTVNNVGGEHGSIVWHSAARTAGNACAKITSGFDSGHYEDVGYLAFSTSPGADNGYERMRITKDGWVGIGTTTPNFFLDVNGIISSCNYVRTGPVTGFTNTGNHPGLFIGANGTQNAVIVADIYGKTGMTMGVDQSDSKFKLQLGGGLATGNFTAPILTANNTGEFSLSGKIGVGTTSPLTKVHVVDGSYTFQFPANQSGCPMSIYNSAGSTGALLFGKNNTLYNCATIRYVHSSDASTANYFGIGMYGRDDILNINAAGSVGVGTTSPSYPLHVLGSGTIGGTSARWFNIDTANITQGYGTGKGGVCAYFQNSIWSSEFVAYSDGRMKTAASNIHVEQPSILDKINDMNVVSYEYIDKIGHDNYSRKFGFIAQELETVFPNMVSKDMSDYIPNIYKRGSIAQAQDGNNVYVISLHNDPVLDASQPVPVVDRKPMQNDIVKIHLRNSESSIDARILNITNDALEIHTKDVLSISCGDVFVYGTKVNDYMSIHTEQVSALAIAGVQALKKELEHYKKMTNLLITKLITAGLINDDELI